MTKTALQQDLLKAAPAIFVGAATIAIITGLYQLSIMVGIFAFIVALFHSLFLGMPLYIMLPDSLRQRWYIATIAGFLIGFAPTFLIGFTDNQQSFSGNYHVYDGNQVVQAWQPFMSIPLYAGLLGMVGGMTTWVVWKFCTRSQK